MMRVTSGMLGAALAGVALTALAQTEPQTERAVGGAEAKPSVKSESVAPSVHPLFQDNAVIQRSAATRIFGTAAPGAEVVVRLGTASATASADESGRWSAALNTEELKSNPYMLSVRSGEEERKYGNVLVGQVFLASGQSNMEMPLYGWGRNSPVLHAEEGTEALLELPEIRFLTVRPKREEAPSGNLPERWIQPDSSTAPDLSAVASFFATDLALALEEPIGIVHASLGGTRVEEWTSSEALKKAGAAAGDSKNSTLFNGMIAPLKGLTFAGVIWYQGESNADRAPERYAALFSAMIADWRAFFGKPDLPFLFVQLAGFGPVEEDPNANPPFAVVREAQRQTSLSVPNVWMAAIPDLGESKDIHPREKREVGRRLSLIAQKRLFGKDAKDAEGPRAVSARREGDAVVVSFADGALLSKPVPEKYVAGTGMEDIPYRRKCGGELETFALRDGNGVWHWASASIVGNEVVVRARGAERPTAVRYNWQSMTLGNLYDMDGFPASPFELEVK